MKPDKQIKRLIYYSIFLSKNRPDDTLLEQLDLSLKTLRAFNKSITIWIFWYGDIETAYFKAVSALVSRIVVKGSYFDSLLRFGRNQAMAISGYPIPHRYLNFDEIDRFAPAQLLYVDCDTIFFDDVAKLFDACREHAVYARAEIGSRRHDPERYDPAYLDEDSLAALAEEVGVGPVAPFNAGVMLFNQPVWQRVPDLPARVIDYIWRFLIWMAMHPQTDRRFTEGRGVDWIWRHRASLRREDAARALPFPSSNRWIVEEVAIWLALGHDRAITVGYFAPEMVTYFAEQFGRQDPPASILCHYFSGNTAAAFARMKQGAATALPDCATENPPPRNAIVIPDHLAASRLMRSARGFEICPGFPDRALVDRLREEALLALPSAKREQRRIPTYPEATSQDYDQDRKVAPRRQKRSHGGGTVQSALYADEGLTAFLTERTGLAFAASGQRGSYAYYTDNGDFIGLHRDTDYCDLVMLTALEDNSDPDDPAGSLLLYPDRVGETCEQISKTPQQGAECVKLRVGDTLIMFGGVIPHRVIPVRRGHRRIVSALCFSLRRDALPLLA